ncbi:MAG: acetate--CoA ligase family protein [Phycisphaerae bacterium]
MELDVLFSPHAVAVVGASNRELTIGHRIIENLLDFGYTGRIYPINPKCGGICGLRSYASILDAPGTIDVAHIVIRNTQVPACVQQCAEKGVKVVIVNTAGFREIGDAGAALEDALVAVAEKTGIRVFGPNCQGIINTDEAVRAYCNFTFTRPQPGHISIIAQSGGVGEVIHQRIAELGVGVRLYASNGNACDVSIPEIIRYYGRDHQTRVIIVHIESLPDARAFLEAAGEVTPHKPILVMKVGRTIEGARAVSSHTGGLMTQDTTVELVFDKAGLVAFRNLEELCQSAVGFASQPVPRGSRVGMIANTGGPAIIATDELIEGGMVMPKLSESTERSLRGALYPESSISNPIDVLATAGPEHFSAALNALLNDESVDAVFLNFVTPFFVDTLGIAREIAKAARTSTKPIIATVMTEKRGWAETLKVIRDAGVPIYDMPDTGAKVLVSMGRYAAARERSKRAGDSCLMPSIPEASLARARVIIRSAGRSAGARPSEEQAVALGAADCFGLLSCYGIPVARYATAQDVDGCVAGAEQIGYPIVLKIDAEGLIHKTDSGGVVLGLQTSDAVRAEAERLLERFRKASPTLLVQEELRPGREVIVGAKAVRGLGHVVMLGLGGIFVEALGDVAFKIAPVGAVEAVEMMEQLKGYPLLRGIRGQPGVDLTALAELIQRVSRMLVDNPTIRELDINPVFTFTDHIKAVDVRVFVEAEALV